MDLTTHLLAAFSRALQPELRAEMLEVTGIGEQLVDLWSACRRALPDVELTPETFFSFVAERMRRDLPPVERLAHLRGAELYLACGCAAGSQQAIAAFEKQYQETMNRAVRRLGLPSTVCSDLLQEIREKLYLSRGDRPAAISQYSGRGSLGGWVRVTCTHVGLNRVQAARRDKEVPVEERAFDALPGRAEDPELRLLKTLYRSEFRAAFKQVWASQPARDRTLLLLNHLDGMSIDAIARIYSVHRATVARWLTKARENLLQSTRDTLADRLGLKSAELDSVLALIESRLDVSLSSVVADGAVPVDK